MPVSKNQTHAQRPVFLGIARQGAEGAKADHRSQEPGSFLPLTRFSP
jgi:hypothetical protein